MVSFICIEYEFALSTKLDFFFLTGDECFGAEVADLFEESLR